MSWLVETPWPAVVLCGVAELALAIMLLRSGRGRLLLAMGGVALLALALVIVERVVVTEREQVEMTLDDLASALKANDVQRAVSFISTSNPGLRSYAQRQLERVRIRDARVTGDLQIAINQRQAPHTAIANFIGRVEGIDRRGHAPYGTFISRFEVQLRQEGGRWLITGYELQELAHPTRKKGPPGSPLPSPVPGV